MQQHNEAGTNVSFKRPQSEHTNIRMSELGWITINEAMRMHSTEKMNKNEEFIHMPPLSISPAGTIERTAWTNWVAQPSKRPKTLYNHLCFSSTSDSGSGLLSAQVETFEATFTVATPLIVSTTDLSSTDLTLKEPELYSTWIICKTTDPAHRLPWWSVARRTTSAEKSSFKSFEKYISHP